ncbi:MAG: inorganic diphosphatase [Acidobacteriota bacterium]
MSTTRKASHPRKGAGTLAIVVETPRGSRNKYKYEEKSGRMKLSKVMPEGMMFPYDFGFVPGTIGEDGDPLDVLVLSDAPTFAGCEVDCRLIGVLEAEQTEQGKTKRNDRIIAVAEVSILYSGVREIEELDPTLLRQIEAFFVNYQKVRDIGYKVIARKGSRAAQELVKAGRKN